MSRSDPTPSPRSGPAPRVSLALPVYDEEEVIPELLDRCRRVLESTPGGPHQIVVVDDGSTDRSRELLGSASAEIPELEVVLLSRNFGHQAAMSAALDHADGDVVLAMDGDLQDPPELLPRFLEGWREGYDVVYAVRRGRKEPFWLRALYFVFYRLIALLSDLRLPLDSGDFALLSRRAVDAVSRTPDRNRYLRGIRTWVGFPQTGIEVERDARAGGRSKYSTGRLLGLAFDGIFAFSVVPLRLATVLGSLAVLVSAAYAAYAVYAKIFLGTPPRGFTALVVAVVFLAGMQMLLLGIVGEYVGRIYREVKRRPVYVVDRILGGAVDRGAPDRDDRDGGA